MSRVSVGRPSGFLFAPLAMAVAALLGCETVAIDPESARLAPDLPLADLHFHPDPPMSSQEARDRMDKNGVRWAGGGVINADRPLWERYARELGPRFIPFTGQSELNRIYRRGGIAAMEDATNPEFQEFLKVAEEDLKGGRAKGIGTIFANNSRGHPDPGFRRKARTDAPSIRLLYGLAAKYDAVVMLQMVPDPDSVAGFERLLASDRRARILWSQCGTDAAPGEVRPLMRRHPNLHCELSWRYPPVVPPQLAFRNIFDETGPKPEWLELIEEFPDRFLVGNDAHIRSQYDRATEVVRTGLLPYLKPATARMVAYANAERLVKLK